MYPEKLKFRLNRCFDQSFLGKLWFVLQRPHWFGGLLAWNV